MTRIIPYEHEARRFQESGSVLIVREPEREIQVYEDQVSYGGVLLPTMADLIDAYCPFPSVGEEVWFAEEFRAWQWSDPHIEYRGGAVAFEGDYRCYLLSDGLTESDVDRSLDSGKQQPSRWLPASKMPEWAARLRGVVVSRNCYRVGAIPFSSLPWQMGFNETSHDFIEHWNATSQTPFDADPWAWVVRVEKNPENP